MLAIQYLGPQSIGVTRVPDPAPGPGEVLLAIAWAGICGTDMTIRAGGHPRARAPLTLGHEVSATVAALGPGAAAAGFAPGEAVTVNPLISCGTCRACRDGHRHVCSSLRLYGIDAPGGMARFLVVPAATLHRLPPGLDPATGALAEPFAVGVHAAALGGSAPGDRVLVAGAGPIGLLTALALRRVGVTDVRVTDVCGFRLALARDLGFAALDVRTADLAGEVARWTGGDGVDGLYEVTGHASAVAGAPGLLRPRGRLVVVGVHKEPRPLDLRAINFREITVVGSRCYTDAEFGEAVAALPDLPVDRLVTHRLPLAEGPAGFAAMLDPEVSCKVLFAAAA